MTSNNSTGLRVLIADDNRDSADSFAILLQAQGHEVYVAYAGEDALAMGARFRPQLVLLDLAMPDIDGYEVARRIRANEWGSSVTLVAVTGLGQANDLRKTRENGFDHHLVKPVEIGSLASVLRKCADEQDKGLGGAT
jgi:CheY-like chemotaxis protein